MNIVVDRSVHEGLGIKGCVAIFINNVHVQKDHSLLPVMNRELERLGPQFESGRIPESFLAYQAVLEDLGYENKTPANVRLVQSFIKSGPKSILNVVDAYNVSVLRHGACIGVHCASGLMGDIKLLRASGEERITPLFKDRQKPIKEGDIVYTHNNQVMATIGKNDIDSDHFKITDDTHAMVAFIIGNRQTSVADNRRALDDFITNLAMTNSEINVSELPIMYE